MKKVLVATEKPFAKTAIDGIREVFEKAGYELMLLEKYPGQGDLITAIANADALIIRSDKVTPEVIEAGKNLRIVVRAGAGYDNVNLDAATKNGVVVMNTPGQNSNAVAELAFGMMVYQARNHFNGSSGSELFGKTLGIHAFGNVGRNVARLARGFGMRVHALDPYVPKEAIESEGVGVKESAIDLYSSCQYISLHIPANDETKGSINYDLMRIMPRNAVLVNTARKEVIDEDSLIRIFEERDDFKYVSDIAPGCADILVEKYGERVFFTPKKMGAQTAEANVNAGIAAANQIVNFLEKGDVTYKVN